MADLFDGTFKVCVNCKKKLPLSSFNKHKGSEDGRQQWCRECATNYVELKTKYKDVGGVKKCRVCGVIKPKTEFEKDDNYKSGYRIICKDCERKSKQMKETPAPVADLDLSKYSIAEITAELKKRGVHGQLNYMCEF